MGNVVQMSLFYDDASEIYISKLELVNMVFSSIFLCEAVVKIFALSFKGYWFSHWNRFDFFVVIASIIDFVIDSLGNSMSFIRVGPQLARV